MYLIVGLGNPGTKYEKTFHNLGFLAAIDAAKMCGAKFKTKECRALTATAYYSGEKIIFALPQTFMNLSGESVKELLAKYKIDLQNLIVIYDDFDLPKGRIRVRAGGSAGTHKGVKNIVDELESGDFKRIRIGIKDDALSHIPVLDFVLSQVRKEDYSLYTAACETAAKAALNLAKGEGVDSVMQTFNGQDLNGTLIE